MENAWVRVVGRALTQVNDPVERQITDSAWEPVSGQVQDQIMEQAPEQNRNKTAKRGLR